LIKGVFFRAEFKMDTFRFSQNTIEDFENDELAEIIYQFIKGKNFFMLQRFEKNELLKKIQQQFPFVTDIQFQREASSTIKELNEEHSPQDDLTLSGDALEQTEDTLEQTEAALEQTGNALAQTEDDASEQTGDALETTGTNENNSVNEIDIFALQTTGNVLGIDLKFAEPLFKVKLGGKEF
jgi:hypothetical protein